MPVPPPRTVLVAFLATLLAFISAPLRAETVMNVATAGESQVTIRVASLWTQNPRFGFAPVRVSIENRAPEERTWRVQFEAGMRNFSIGVLNTEQSITVPAGHTRDVWIFVPVAEPGMNISGSPFPFRTPPPGGVAPVITNIPGGGKKVVRVIKNPDGTTSTVETVVDTVAGKIITTTTAPGGAVSVQTRSFPLDRGTTVTFTIDPDTGIVGTPRRRPVSGFAPARVMFLTGGAGGGGYSTAARTIGPSTPMVLVAEVTGPGVQGSGRINFPGSTSSNDMRSFAVSAPLEPAFRSRLAILTSGAPNLSAIDPAQLPADWRVWSACAGVLLTTDEYAALDSARKAALRGWVALGGQLCLAPATAAAAGGSEARTEKLGAGIIVTLAEPLAAVSPSAAAAPAPAPVTLSPAEVEKERLAKAREEAARRAAARRGGRPVPTPPATPLRPEDFFPLGPDVKLFESTNGMPDQAALHLDPLGPLGEHVKDEGGENPWLALFLVVFAIVVGPVNLFIFAPSNRRHRLFLTTPLIALVASVLLGVAILVGDGLGGDGVRRTLVVVLPGDNQTAVFQEQAVRTGFLFGRTFPLPEDVQLTHIPLEEPRWGGPGTTFLRQGPSAGGDWFQNRARQAHLLQRLVPTRGRVEQVGTAANGAPIVQSSLGAALREFVCIDEAGERWKTAQLAPGQRVTLERGGIWIGSGSGAVVPGGSERFNRVLEAAAQTGPGQWCARGTGAEFAPIPTLGSVRWQDGDVMYTGTLETTTAAGASPESAAKTKGQP